MEHGIKYEGRRMKDEGRRMKWLEWKKDEG
jgi:hypothetical protein